MLKVSAGSVFPATSSPGVPGRAAGIVFRGDIPIPPPAINDAGEVVFRARSAANFDNNIGVASGLYAKRPGFPLDVLVDTTEIIPGSPTYPVPGRPANNRFVSFKPPIINNAGDVVFQATFLSPGTTPSSGTGIYATKVTGGPIVKLVDTFSAVPNDPTSTFNTFDPNLGTVAFTTCLNDMGQVAYWGRFLIPGNSTQRTGLFGTNVSGGAGVRLADSVGASGPVSVPVGLNDFFSDIRFVSAINNSGTVVFSAGMPGGLILRGGIYVVDVAGGPITTVAIQGQPVPGRPGETFQGTFEPGGHSVDINDSGIVVFRNQYKGVFSPPSESGIYAATPSGGGYVHTRIFDTQAGQTIPGEPAGAEYGVVEVPSINSDGLVAPFATVSPGSPMPNQQGVFHTDVDGAPNSVVATLATPPPGLPAPVSGFPRFSSLSQSNGGRGSLNDLGNVAFLGSGSVSPGVGFRGVYFYDLCTPELIRVSDSTISAAQLGAVVSLGYDLWQVETTTGMYRSLNINNDLAFAAQFTAFDYGLYIAHIETGGSGQLNITCPPDVVAQCPADTDPSETGTAMATGCGTITISHSDVISPGCGATSTIIRTWSATNGSSVDRCEQSIMIVDTTGPVLSGVPDKASAECGAVPPPADVTALDGCEGSVGVTLSESSSAGPCAGTYILTRDWIATDGCGNTTLGSHQICVLDSLDPGLMGVPGDVTVECDAVPLAAMVTGSDQCDPLVDILFNETRINGGCDDEYLLQRSWTAVDECGNDVTATQVVTVEDTTPPTIHCPPHASLECPADTSVAANGLAMGSDPCGGVAVSSSDASVAGCGTTQTITRTWSAADECNNLAVCEQLVSVVDTTAPAISLEATPITVTDTDCSGSQAVSLPSGTAQDACDGPRPVTNDAPALFPTGTTAVNYTALDACGNAAQASLSVNVLYGANLEVQADRHTVGAGTHPGSTKTPLVDIVVCAYDKTDGSCARTLCDGVAHQQYQCILDSCTPVACDTTDSTGLALINLPPGNYIAVSGDATKTTLPDPLGVSVGEVQCGETKHKYLQQIVRADGSMKPAKYTVLTGSQLLIIEPEFIIWDDTEQLYPFVFETIGDWMVTASVAPPEGFVADYDALTAEVDNELESVQFTITEVGSDLVPTETKFEIVHKGKRKTVRSKVDILLTPDYARSRGFDVEKLRSKGLIVEPQAPGKDTKAAQ